MRLNKTQSYLLITSCLVLLSLLYSCNKKEPITSEVIEVDGGFGYEVSYKNRVLIKQEYIPAISFRKAFATKEDAAKIAEVVKGKLMKKQKPIINKEEIDSLHINIEKYED
ncbi:DUF4907 domain-containing protein [Joostella atrarenae]|uniref:DUF4907 domain-containing protein n=1 Tax=Joostella atrarenae TaxID=679257 RepID=A0ABS9J4G8_9FLAO|nr:DUF4907 domain-containing protein [Joostella atrarenae]MCF8715289.1 DUF4907 domain-containing protein [Joostella atrarenae]